MKNVTIFVGLVLALVLAPTAHAGPWKNEPQNIKLPSQQVLQVDSWTAPAAASATLYKNLAAANNGTVTTFTPVASPDFARNVVITTGGSTANVGAGTAVVTGTDIYGRALSENFTISGAQNGATTGAKAFRSVSSVSFPATTGANVQVSIGTGSLLGVKYCMNNAGAYAWSVYDGAFETTRGTVAASASSAPSNTFNPHGSLDGAHDVQLYYVQNYRCY